MIIPTAVVASFTDIVHLQLVIMPEQRVKLGEPYNMICSADVAKHTTL